MVLFMYTDKIDFTFNGSKFILSDFRLQSLTESYPNHYHGENSYEIHFFSDGIGHMKIDDNVYDIRPNTLIITGPFVNHEQIPISPLTKYSIYFTIDQSENNDSLIEKFTSKYSWCGEDNNNCLYLLKAIKDELEKKKIGYKTSVIELLKLTLISIIRNYNETYIAPQEKKANDLAFTIEAIFLQEFKTITVKEMAERLFLSERQLQRFLQKNYKKTFNSLKLEARVNYAIHLLKNTSKSITEISQLCGYSTPEHFTVAFKKITKTTPLKYKKNNLEK